MRKFLILLSAFVSLAVCADKISLINDLITRGNRAYDLSQRTRIKQCADSALMLLSSGNIAANDSIDLLTSIYKLYGNYYYENEDFSEAEVCYDKAQIVIDTNPNVSYKSLTKLLLLRDKAQLYYRLGNYPAAAELMALADDEIEFQSPYEVGSDDWLITKLSYAMCLARLKEFEKAINIATTELENAIDKNSLSFAKTERMFAKILMLADADRSGALKAYKDFFNKQRQDALGNLGKMNSQQRNEYWQTLRPFIADCYLLEDADPGFLYDVTLFAKGLLLQLERFSGKNVASDKALKTLTYNWTDIQKRLKPKQSAIEFIQYEKNGKTQMAALILKPTGKPQFISITSPDEILSSVEDKMRSTDRINKDALYEDEYLHNLVWTENLLCALAGSNRIYFAPDGYLHRLAIEYMPPVENIEMYRLSSTRRLMDSPSTLAVSAPALFVGGINYDLDKAPGDIVDNDAQAYSNYIGKSFPRLSESSNEAKSIYESRGNSTDSLIMASKASEHIFKELADKYESILVSTHGDFCASIPIPTDIKVSEEDETMSQNIIAFAGVNSYLQDKKFNASNHYDGLLSAGEISHLDLSKCKLFTISACQSALGHISSDGVFGLQRGLKNAGVDVMLLSLWNVNSDATSILMKLFYNNLNKGMSAQKAFASARKHLMTSVSEIESGEVIYEFDPATMSSKPVSHTIAKSFNSPQYTHAFIMIDALE